MTPTETKNNLDMPGAGSHFKSAVVMVSCLIRPERLEAVNSALHALNLVGGMTVAEVKGFGRQKGITEYYRGGAIHVRFHRKVRLDLAIPASNVDQVISEVRRHASTGSVGDGKIFVSGVEQVMRIRTGEKGECAL